MAKEINKTHREPLFHVLKRPSISFGKALFIRIAAILIAFVVCALISGVLVNNATPVSFFESVFKGSFGTTRKIWKLFKDISVLLCISLAITPAFRMKFWNIGAEGQVLVGALACAACMYYLNGKASDPVIIICMFAASVLAGMMWAGIPALFKAQWNTNETLFTLMMNYIATYLVAYFLIKWTPNGSSSLGILPAGHLPRLGHEYLLIIVSVALLTVLVHIYLNYSKHGYEISVVGESEKTARYIGINVKKVIIRTMLFSGALCGIAAFLIVGGLDHTVTENTVGGLGFTAIMVSWLAKFKPFNMIFTSLLIVFLKQGAAQLSQDFDISSAFPNIVVGIILFFVIGCEFFINYRIARRSSAKEAK
ncbi:MAG: ABC transporter permease [Eubacteriales bacterium]|nr:ABC transporter permease [Eubacteriales bacterium]